MVKLAGGQKFYGLFHYLLKKEQEPQIIFNSTLYDTPRKIAGEFSRVADYRPTTQNPVKHISIAFAPEDGKIDSLTQEAIAQKIVTELGYTNNQWVAISHGRNTPNHKRKHDHDHFHIAINMITYDGQRINDWKDWHDLSKTMKNLELEYDLKPVHSTPNNIRYPKKVQYQKYQEQFVQWLQDVEIQPDLKPPEEPEIQTLEAIIQAASEDKPTLTEYLARLQTLGYKVNFYQTDAGRKRLKYQLKSTGKEINKLKGGSLNQLKKLGVDYDSKRDNPAIIAMKSDVKIAIADSKLLKSKTVEKYRYRWLNIEDRNKLSEYQTINLKTEKKPALNRTDLER